MITASRQKWLALPCSEGAAFPPITEGGTTESLRRPERSALCFSLMSPSTVAMLVRIIAGPLPIAYGLAPFHFFLPPFFSAAFIFFEAFAAAASAIAMSVSSLSSSCATSADNCVSLACPCSHSAGKACKFAALAWASSRALVAVRSAKRALEGIQMYPSGVLMRACRWNKKAKSKSVVRSSAYATVARVCLLQALSGEQ